MTYTNYLIVYYTHSLIIIIELLSLFNAHNFKLKDSFDFWEV
jgi:hypothetical protein